VRHAQSAEALQKRMNSVSELNERGKTDRAPVDELSQWRSNPLAMATDGRQRCVAGERLCERPGIPKGS